MKNTDPAPSNTNVEKLEKDIHPENSAVDKADAPKDQKVANGEKEPQSAVLNDDPNIEESNLKDLKKYEDNVDPSTKKKMKDKADGEVEKGPNHNSKTKALVMARIIAETNDKADTPVPVLMGELAALKAMKGVTGFGYKSGNAPGEFRILMYGSEYTVDPNYTTKRQQNFEQELQTRKDIDPEMAEKMREYNNAVPNGTLDVDDVKKKLENGEVFDHSTKRFSDPNKSEVIDYKANVKETEKISHSDFEPHEKTELNSEIGTRKKAVDKREKAKSTHGKKSSEYKAAQQEVVNSSERLGDISTKMMIEKRFPGSKKLPFETPGGKQGQFDHVFEHNGKIYIVESKGGSSGRGSRIIGNGKRAEQGTPEYRDSILENMIKNGDPETKKTALKIYEAIENGELEYTQVSQKVNHKTGELIPEIIVSKF